MSGGFRIEAAETLADLAEVAALFRAYAVSLPIDLGYQGFEAELAALPGRYAPPEGVLLLARDGEGRATGCVALRAIAPAGTCEMKRLYVAPEARGSGLGERLARRVIGAAARAGYRTMVLDTLDSMAPALALYRRLGFAPTPPYYDTPIAGTVFLRRDLSRADAAREDA